MTRLPDWPIRPDDFSPNSLGEVRLVGDGDYWAFYPARLVYKIVYSDELVQSLEKATGALHRLSGVGRLLPNPHLLISPSVRLEAVLSPRIEGTQSDVADLLAFEVGDDASLASERADVEEVRNYVTALDYGIQRLRDGFPLNMRLLREVHEQLMAGVRGSHATPGEFRKSQNWIGGTTPSNAAFVPPPVEAIGPALDDLEQFLHDRSLPLLVQLAIAHYQFEAIHPFLDGNGRLGRLLIPLVMAERSVLPQPLLYMSVYFERNRNEYYDLLMSTSRTGDIVPWLIFFLEGVATQAADAENRTVHLVELQSALRANLLNDKATTTALRAAELLFSRPYVSANWLAGELGVSYPTAQTAINTLVERGDLTETTGRRRNRFYMANRIFEAIYREPSRGDPELSPG